MGNFLLKLGILFHKNPCIPSNGIDIVRLKALAKGFIEEHIDTEIIAPVEKESIIDGIVPVKPLKYLSKKRYDIVKTCYHFSMDLLSDYKGPVISRIVRVVDEKLPPRDEDMREKLLICQELIVRRSSALSLNNIENRERWYRFYGKKIPVILTPTGCPKRIPPPGVNPYNNKKVILFLGSLCAGRMVNILNEMALRLKNTAAIHFIGKNKTGLYGGKEELSKDIVCHGEIPEEKVWNYIRYGTVGLALATGPCPFDNDISKIVNYLRGGLPVLSEENIINNNLIKKTDYGKIFKYDNMDDLTGKAKELLDNPPFTLKKDTEEYMIKEHSWKRRVGIYIKLFETLFI